VNGCSGYWLELWTLDQVSLCSNLVLLCKILGKFSLYMYCSSLFSYMNEHLATESCGYLFANSLCALIAVWLEVKMVLMMSKMYVKRFE